MTSFERPTSIELEVQPKDESQIPLKQREILNDLFDLTKMAGLPPRPIGGFQKNNDGTFTITLNTTDLPVEKPDDRSIHVSPLLSRPSRRPTDPLRSAQ